jgi:hypothetical protein
MEMSPDVMVCFPLLSGISWIPSSEDSPAYPKLRLMYVQRASDLTPTFIFMQQSLI